MIRVLFLITTFRQGGAERSLYELVRHIDRERFAPQVACLEGEAYYSERFRSLGVPVHHLGLRALGPPAMGAGSSQLKAFGALCGRLAWLAGLLRRERVQVLQTLLLHANLAGRFAGTLARTPVVVGGVRTADPRHWHTLLDGLTFALTRGEVCVSGHVRRFQASRAGLPLGALTVIPNGVDAADFPVSAAPFGLGEPEGLSGRLAARAELGLPPDRPVLAFLGRLAPAKALPDLLSAFAVVAARDERPLLALAGDGPLAAWVRGEVRRLGLGERVVLTGWVSQPARLYAAADAFVLSSVVEGMPRTVLEAMASGLPVVSTDAPGCGELIVEGRTGLIVPRRKPRDLTDALLGLLSDPERAAEFGRRGRERAFAEFNVADLTRRYEALYVRLLQSALRPARQPARASR
ncbi:MAG: glycosyltransferase [Candidatus Brocadiia bacterium]|jgi:glycosyltransferase involved in cell wall biosynthesis|nr:glycosyltransferase [Candidatus Brocadiia bacterium]